MKSLRPLLVVFVLVFTSASNIIAQSWQLVWADEFTNGISGDWVFETGAGGWGNNEYQYYRRENATVENGQLVITAKREAFGGANYTSARMKTQGKKSWKYGKMEARIAMPSFSGIWPAFWMLGDNISSVGWPNCGEIDIMEHVNAEQRTYGTIHWTGSNGAYAQYGGNTGVNNIGAYHVYTVEWDANTIRWYLDGAKFHEVNIAGGVNGTSEFHNNFFILLNMAVGGNWPGFNIDNNGFPAKMYVDYVRVYQMGSNPPPPSGGVATFYKDCNFGGYAVGLPAGSYNVGDLQARGIQNDDISSLKVNNGYEAVLFWDGNYAGSSLVVRGENACLVNNGWNDKASSLIIRPVTSSYNKFIEAESYSAMAGVQTEPCNEGGTNVGYIDNGDWMAYNAVNFPTSGNYKIEYRVASLAGGGRLSADLNAGAVVLGALNVPSTGGWQNWTTISHTVYVNAGTYNLGVFSATGGWNLNWIRITKTSARTSQSADIDNNMSADMTEESIELYPNPADADLNIATSTGVAGLQYMVVNAVGETVMNGTLSAEAISVSTLNTGIYTLVVYKEDGTKLTKRFVKQ